MLTHVTRAIPGQAAPGRKLGWPSRSRAVSKSHEPQAEALTEASAVPTAVPTLAGPVEAPSRFQGGALRPVDLKESGDKGVQTRKTWRLFDRLLLAGEIISAVVVTWLVAQYIYTAYFDTTPHRLTGAGTANHGGISGQAGAQQAQPTRTATKTPLLASATPWASGAWAVPVLSPTAAESSPTVTPTPTATVDPALLLPKRIRIPVMFLDSPVHEVHIDMGTWEVSPLDVGHHEGSANPGETGNVVMAAHRDINSALFRDLDRLQPGDEVFVSNSLREYRYIVKESFVVSPQHTEVMDPTTDKRLTLITCTPIGLATQRLIVTAELDETPDAP